MKYLDFSAKLRDLKLAPLKEEDVLRLVMMGVEPAPVIEVPTEVHSNLAERQRFVFGKTSMERLSHLRPELRNVVLAAINVSLVDMTVVQTIRSIEEQKRNVANGASRTMKSKHLPQADGFAWAVDLAAFVDGKISWDTKYYADIAFAMDQMATKLGFAMHIRWGAAWDRVLADFGGTRQAYLDEAEAYAKRHAGSDLIDMPHFEWVA